MQAIQLPGKTQITAGKLGRTADPFVKDNDSHWNTSWGEAELPKLIIQRSLKDLRRKATDLLQ